MDNRLSKATRSTITTVSCIGVRILFRKVYVDETLHLWQSNKQDTLRSFGIASQELVTNRLIVQPSCCLVTL